jgi:hypothetical protein
MEPAATNDHFISDFVEKLSLEATLTSSFNVLAAMRRRADARRADAGARGAILMLQAGITCACRSFDPLDWAALQSRTARIDAPNPASKWLESPAGCQKLPDSKPPFPDILTR